MDPRTVEINNLRILNDYLNQTIEAMARAQRAGVGQFSTNGLSHTPFGVSPFGAAFAGNHFGVDPTHTAYNPYFSPYGVGSGISQPYASMIDPFQVQRALPHAAPLGTPWGQWSPIAELARREELVRQQQQLQALAGYRGWGVPV